MQVGRAPYPYAGNKLLVSAKKLEFYCIAFIYNHLIRTMEKGLAFGSKILVEAPEL